MCPRELTDGPKDFPVCILERRREKNEKRSGCRYFPDVDYTWLVAEIKENLPRELDFTHEAQNAERCRANLASPRSTVRGRVHIPRLYPDHSGPRVLVMEFVEGKRGGRRGGPTRSDARFRTRPWLADWVVARTLTIP